MCHRTTPTIHQYDVNCDHVCHNETVSIGSSILPSGGNLPINIGSKLYIQLEELQHLLHIDNFIYCSCNIFPFQNEYHHRLRRNIAIVLFFIDVIQFFDKFCGEFLQNVKHFHTNGSIWGDNSKQWAKTCKWKSIEEMLIN